jgi:dynein heavy chain 2
MEGVKDLVGCTVDNEEEDDDDHNSKYDSKRDGKREESKSQGKRKVTKAEGDALIENILSIHASSSAYGATPKDYIVFLQTWQKLYDTKKAEVLRELGHLEAGLSKLDTATEVVNDLRTNAVTQEKDLRVAQAAADKAMDEISKALAGASDRRQEVGDIKRTVDDNESKTQERKREIEGELAEVQPLLEEAKTAVGSIRSDHLNELKSLASPPEAVADVLAGVLMLLGMSDLSWAAMKKFLSNRGVKDDILNYDGSKIDDDLRKKVSKLIKSKSNSYEADTIKRASVAAAPLAAWVKANIKYSLVMEKIQPLTDQLNEEIAKLEESQKQLRRCEKDLEEIDDRVAELKREFATRTAEAERLKRNLEIAATTLDKAEGLIGQLGGEQARWKAQAAHLQADLSKLPSKVLLAAGFSTYLAKTPEDVRATMISTWQDITDIRDFSFRRVMSTESELLQWKTMGLSADSLSQENSLVINYAATRVPFIIDPASAATEWLKCILSKDKSRPLEVVTHHDSRFCNQVELAVRFGKTLLILEADGLEPVLYPLCRNDLMHQGARYVVSVGDKVVDYNECFRMFLVTRNPYPDLPPDAAALVSEINFTVTKGGLEGQLLGVAIQHEQPELERAKGEMLRQEEDFKVQLAGLEKGLLEALATAEGNLLENTSLIESLTKTKETSAQIEESLVKSAEMSKKLDEQREVYRPFALAGSKIYFLVKALQVVSNMYQFSLASFLGLFNSSLAAEMNARSIDDRLAMLCSDLEVRVLHFVGRALFKTDRPMFALHLVKGMHPDHFQPKEWEIFTGALVASVAEGIPRGFPSWTPSDRQGSFRLLVEHLPHLVNSLELENAPKWQRFASSAEAEKDIPALRGVSPFQRVLIVQAFRPDRLQSALLQFCNDMLRVESISPPPLSLSTLLLESSSSSPILLISSPGADASKELQEFALKTVGVGGYEELAMGGGQLQLAIEMIRSTASRGGWLCLKNLHLVVAWLPTLEKELSTLKAKADFRLWLTSESHSAFPSILLQESLKATYEAPPGIKKNLQRAFDSWDPESFDTSNPTQSRLLFLLACFHAVIQERRNYIPQGWTKFYEFSYGDMRAGTFVMEAASRATSVKNPQLDWEAIYGLMEDAIYGGRIDNSYDLRVLRAYLKMFFSEKLVSEKGVGMELLPNTPLRMPSTPSYDVLKKAINQLADIDAPYFFSLPDNIERTLQRVTSSAVIKQLRSLSALDAEAMKYDREKWKVQLGPLLEQWQEMTSSTAGLLSKRRDVTVNGANQGNAKIALHDPVDDFVNMECDLAGELCTLVDGAMVSMKKILFGSGLLTPNIQAIAAAILSDTVPNEWTQRWDGGPDKPQAWMRELIRKRISLMKLKALAQKGQILNGDPLMLGDFFHPGIFSNALRQQTSRQLGIAMERTKMVSSWDKDAAELKKICPLPCFLSGMLLQGATFHGGLQESSNDANELTPIPNVCIGFIGDDEKEPYSRSDMVGIPLYFSPSREEFLMELKMPTDNDQQDKWILAGCALFLTPE